MPLPAILASAVTQLIVSLVSSLLSDAAKSKLRSRSTRKSVRVALGAAIRSYASSGLRLGLVESLLARDSFLTEKAVADEIAELLLFRRQPDADLIAKRWKNRFQQVPSGVDFIHETGVLLDLIRNELKANPTFQPVFELQTLEAISQGSVVATEVLKKIDADLIELAKMVDGRFGALMKLCAAAVPPIRSLTRDFSSLIMEKNEDSWVALS